MSVSAIALDETTDPPLLPLPLRAVHDVAAQLLDTVGEFGLAVDREAVLFGAATHDIGKAVHPAELSGPGSLHEEAGRELLLARRVPAGLARFAGTHAAWQSPEAGPEDLLVSLADKIWKNKRVTDLEDLVVAELSRACGRPVWEVFLRLDETLTRIGEAADSRLAWQAAHPVHAGR
ncbi:HD domain-containing protein [Streptomyces sp. 4F14]|uniref:HD domain-containing protein n=1 Tax=Streptomyces sp. 4F14 TaxID=3394380 RepID=UPI003A85A88C